MKRVVAHAPGRVNLIGEHTDYNDGFVMPMAIGFGTSVEACERRDRLVTIRSEYFPDDLCNLHLDALDAGPARHWTDYVRGVLVELAREGVCLPGADLRITSTLPIGAGLSSSAALLVATALAMLELAGAALDGVRIARLAQRAENLYAGARSGIMDQFVSANARTGCALMLDTRSLAFEHLALPPSFEIVVCNTMVKHSLAGGEYNRRREECEASVAVLTQRFGITSLRWAALEHLNAVSAQLGDVLYRRAKHVVTENARVLEAAGALARQDCAGFGAAMNVSHASLQHDFEVSCEELDIMAELARRCDGVYGARMMGGGFGGCVVAMVEAGRAQETAEAIGARYEHRTGISPAMYSVRPSGGASVTASMEMPSQ